jgi:hypothetical protein
MTRETTPGGIEQPKDPYEAALARFDELNKEPFDLDIFTSAMSRVQATGFTTGKEPADIYSTLMTLGQVGIDKATAVGDESSVESMQLLQQGFSSALERFSPKPKRAQRQPSTPRSASRVSAG